MKTPDTTLLFDTGANGDILLENMKKLDLDPKKISAVMLSHDHWDHTGGLSKLLSINPNVVVMKPTFSMAPTEIYPGFMTTGILHSWSGIKEQSLICKTEKGQVVITGCSHPGLEKIISVARKFGNIHGVIGGFHGFDKFEALQGISIIVPCHCTFHKTEIQKLFPEAYEEGGVGKKLEFSD